MNQMDPKANTIIRVALTLTGLGLIAGGLIYWYLTPDSPDNMRYILGGALSLAGFTDLVLSWFIFKRKEQ